MKEITLLLILPFLLFSAQNSTTCCFDNQILHTSDPVESETSDDVLLQDVFYQRSSNSMTSFFEAKGGSSTGASACDGVGINLRYYNGGRVGSAHKKNNEWVADYQIKKTTTTSTQKK